MGDTKRASLNLELPLITSMVMLAIVLLVLASGYWSYGKWITAVETQRLGQFSQLQADKRAADIAHYIGQQQQQLDQFAKRSSLLRAVTQAEAEANTMVLNSLRTAYPQALSFKLLDLERQEHLTSEQADLSFTELDMINRAERRQNVPPEALRVEQRWYLHFITPLLSDAPPDASRSQDEDSRPPVTGTLMVTLPAEDLFARIQRLEPGLGQTRLQRRNPGKPVMIFSSGDGAAGPSHTARVGDSEWQIAFTPSTQLAQQAAESPWLLIALHLVGGGLLLALGFWLTGKIDPLRQPSAARSGQAPEATLTNPMLNKQDILDIQVAAEDEDVLGLNGSAPVQQRASDTDTANPDAHLFIDEIFRAYDIRGLAGSQINVELARHVGRAVASEALAAGDTHLFVARDGRTHSPELCEALIEGAVSTGCHVINLGAVPTPLLYFATCELSDSNSGVMITASHNSAEYNGFKMVINGHTLVNEDVQQIKTRMQQRDYYEGQTGTQTSQQILPQYIDRIFSDVALAGDVKLVIDAGNGITGEVAPLLFEELGCEVEPLFCEVDGSFPNHDPDPTIEANLQTLIRTVQTTGADVGVAFDGDGDRLVLVTPKGDIIWPDRLLMLFAKDIVSRNPGADVLFDVKCTRELNSLISSYGGRPIMWKAGHSNMKSKMQETGALLGGELSGHIFIKDRWYGFDDGMYVAARLLEIMTLRDQDLDSLFASFPTLPSTPELKIPAEETRKFELVDALIRDGNFQDGKPITIDGLRVDFAKGWGLVRASNTSAALTLRFEAETQEALQQLQQLFKRELLKVDNTLQIPF